ncbi:MAG: OmpH family outer membrane protein [Negativicutes bacterium]|nr:OmpH family outer membrane protein [Negativicutes bacterium]
MLKIEKKQVKIVSVVIAAFFLLGIVGIALSQSGKTYAAAPASNVGVVNYQQLIAQHPDAAAAQETMKNEVAQTQKEFDAKAATLTSDKEKQDYFMQLQQRLNGKQQELLAAINDKVVAAIKAVAEAKGLAVVVDKGAVVYGGQDITDDVMKKITGK